MYEFGEKLKSAREEKGMTQQTLANNLYVTRQAVSRWECGARYPDLMTAKKISVILGISLDELLSGAESARYTAESPIAESAKAFRIQCSLYAFAVMAHLLMCILSMGLLLPISSEMFPVVSAYNLFHIGRYMLITLLLFYGLSLSVRGNLSQKKAGLIAAAYFLTAFFSKLFLHAQIGLLLPAFLQTLIYMLCALIILNCFYFRNHFPPTPVYLVSGLCLIKNLLTYTQAFQAVTELSFVIRTIELAATTGLMLLICYQSYILDKRNEYSY